MAYIKINNENCHAFDVDETLVHWEPFEGAKPLVIKHGPYSEVCYPNLEIIKRIKKAKVRGQYVIVHSQGGVDWAESAVKALQLEDYVDLIMTKVKWFWDDVPPNEWASVIDLSPIKDKNERKV